MAAYDPSVENSTATPTSTVPLADEQTVLARWEDDLVRAARYHAKRLGPHADPDDLAQEARIRLVRVVRRSPLAPEPYFRRVISNAVKTAARRQRQVPEYEEFDSVEREADYTGLDHDVLAIVSVAAWIESLPRRPQELFHLLYREQRSQREAARLLGVSQPRVAQMHNALLASGRSALSTLAA